MTVLAFIIAIYTLPMLLIHVSTAKILEAWGGAGSSRIQQQFPPRRALRVEALYWLLALAAWPVWRAAGWKALVVLFAAIHIGVWLSNEFGKVELSGANARRPAHSARLNRAIIAFDLVEAAMLAAIGILSVLYLVHSLRP
ncbi:MAG: hypothetical protein ACRD1N_06980 [Terriglobia bacterium]